jgi:hypothetical protein
MGLKNGLIALTITHVCMGEHPWVQVRRTLLLIEEQAATV